MQDLLDYAVHFGEKLNKCQVEAFSIESKSLTTQIERKQVKSIDTNFDAGLGIRILLRKNGKDFLGSSYTMDTRKSGIEKATKMATSIALIKPAQKEFVSFHDCKRVHNVKGIFDVKVESIQQNNACDLANEIIRVASDDKNIVSVSGDLLFLEYDTSIANSLGVKSDFISSIFKVSCYVTVKEMNSNASAGDDYSNRFFNEEKAIEVARNSKLMAISQLNPKTVKKGKMDMVIGPDAITSLMENTFAMMIRADQIQRGQSPYVDKIGTRVSSESVNIVDDGTKSSAIGSKPYDDEGYPTQKTIVVNKGILESFLFDSSSGAKINKSSTGNAIRPSSGNSPTKYLIEPIVGHTNLLIREGIETFDSIISSVKDGIYVRQILGSHTSNRITGEFSVFPLVAYKIENGEIKDAVKEAMIGGNIQQLLENVSMIGKDLKQCQGNYLDTAIIAPTLKVEKVTLSA